MEKFKPFIIPVALLVLIDQTVKIVISKVFMKCEFDIIAKVLRFNPELNSVCSLSNLFFRFHTTTLTEACSNELKQHHL